MQWVSAMNGAAAARVMRRSVAQSSKCCINSALSTGSKSASRRASGDRRRYSGDALRAHVINAVSR